MKRPFKVDFALHLPVHFKFAVWLIMNQFLSDNIELHIMDTDIFSVNTTQVRLAIIWHLTLHSGLEDLQLKFSVNFDEAEYLT